MIIRFTQRHMVGGTDHQHIAKLKWIADVTSQEGETTRADLVEWFRDKDGQGYVKDSTGNKVSVRVVDANPPYLRTVADGKWTDNLLALPAY